MCILTDETVLHLLTVRKRLSSNNPQIWYVIYFYVSMDVVSIEEVEQI